MDLLDRITRPRPQRRIILSGPKAIARANEILRRANEQTESESTAAPSADPE